VCVGGGLMYALVSVYGGISQKTGEILGSSL